MHCVTASGYKQSPTPIHPFQLDKIIFNPSVQKKKKSNGKPVAACDKNFDNKGMEILAKPTAIPTDRNLHVRKQRNSIWKSLANKNPSIIPFVITSPNLSSICSAPATLFFLLFFEHNRYPPAMGFWHWMFLYNAALSPAIHMAHCLTSFMPLLKYITFSKKPAMTNYLKL